MSCLQSKMLSYKLKSKNALIPMKTYWRDVGFELYSADDKVIPPRSRALINTDVSFTFPFGYYGLIIPIPEISIKHHVDVINFSVENEIESIKVLMINNSDLEYIVKKSDRIALMIVNKYFDHFIMFESIQE